MGLPSFVSRGILRSGVAITAVIGSSSALAQSAPGAADPAATPAQADETIVIVADPGARTSIDRTTYVVRDNAEARSSSTLDLLTKVPFVDSTPDGQIRLMGKAGVKILIDGQDVGDPATVLGNLQGSQVAKIEVITNPSAQFAAEGTSGIINIVTRRALSSGLGGSATASAGSYGAYDLKFSPTWSRGPLSLSGSFNLSHNSVPSGFRRERDYGGAGGGEIVDSIERGILRTAGDNVHANLVVSYKPTAKQTLSLTAFILASDQSFSGASETTTAGGLHVGRETRAGEVASNIRDVSAEYQQDGAREGEKLTISAKSSWRHLEVDNLFATDRPAEELEYFSVLTDNIYSFTSLKLDLIRPFGKKRRLSLGGSVQRTRSDQLLEFGEPRDAVLDGRVDLSSSWLETGGYVTYETPFLGGVILAGLRLEGRSYEVPDEFPGSPPSRTEIFPSLHFERKLTKKVTAALSYSRRIAWPGITELDPALRFSDPTTATAGNPDLQPEITDSYEAKLTFALSAHNIDVATFFRRTGNAWADSIELDGDGVLVKRTVNTGTRTLSGVSLALSGPLLRGLRYSLNGDFGHQDYRLGPPDTSFAGDGADYGGSAEIEYRDGVEGKKGADHLTLNASYRSPYRFLLSRSSSSPSVRASWSHALTDRLTGIVKVDDLLGVYRFRTAHFSESGFSREVTRIPGPRVTFSLTYDLRRRPES